MAHVVVTGASSGIGEALVREYVRAGASVTMVARRREMMEKLAAEVGGKTHVVATDLSDPAHAIDWLPAAEAALGPIDVLINNAGAQIVGHITDADWPRARAMMELDLLTPLALVAAVLPKMLARRSGTIVNIASMAALAPTPYMFYYNAAKAGLAQASESLRGELRKTGVHVMTVYPGPVDTPMARASYAIMPPDLTVRILPGGNTTTMAKKIRRGVESRRGRIIYPWLYAVPRHLPALTRVVLDLFTPPPRPQLPASDEKKALPP